MKQKHKKLSKKEKKSERTRILGGGARIRQAERSKMKQR